MHDDQRLAFQVVDKTAPGELALLLEKAFGEARAESFPVGVAWGAARDHAEDIGITAFLHHAIDHPRNCGDRRGGLDRLLKLAETRNRTAGANKLAGIFDL